MQMRKMACVLGAAALFSGVVHAQGIQQGDWLVRAGVAHVEPNDSSDRFTDRSSGDTTGIRVGVGSDTGLGLNITYMATDNLGVQLLAATPFTHDINGRGDLSGRVGEIKHLPPTLTLQYHFLPRSSIRPYAGAGINYTVFFSEKTRNLGGARLSLDDAVGWALEAGVDVELQDRWFLNAALWYLNIETTARVKGGDLDLDLKGDVDINPWVMMVGAGYRF